jgi:predicted nuclease of predicted toxin-antitoxin system
MSDYVDDERFEQNYLDLCDWAYKHLHLTAVEDSLNSAGCKCVMWTKCSHAKETYRRLEGWQTTYNKEFLDVLKDIDKHILTCAHDHPDKTLDREVRNVVKRRIQNIKTYMWVKKNISPWELSQIRIRKFGTAHLKDLSHEARIQLIHMLDEIARDHKWEDKVKRC